MRETSLSAYDGIQKSIASRQQAVYVALAMARRPCNNQELADYLHKPINTITPRVNELVKMGKVHQAFKAIYPATGRRVIYWQVSTNNLSNKKEEE